MIKFTRYWNETTSECRIVLISDFLLSLILHARLYINYTFFRRLSPKLSTLQSSYFLRGLTLSGTPTIFLKIVKEHIFFLFNWYPILRPQSVPYILDQTVLNIQYFASSVQKENFSSTWKLYNGLLTAYPVHQIGSVTKNGGNTVTLHYKLGTCDFECEDPMESRSLHDWRRSPRV